MTCFLPSFPRHLTFLPWQSVLISLVKLQGSTGNGINCGRLLPAGRFHLPWFSPYKNKVAFLTWLDTAGFFVPLQGSVKEVFRLPRCAFPPTRSFFGLSQSVPGVFATDLHVVPQLSPPPPVLRCRIPVGWPLSVQFQCVFLFQIFSIQEIALLPPLLLLQILLEKFVKAADFCIGFFRWVDFVFIWSGFSGSLSHRWKRSWFFFLLGDCSCS